MTTKVPRETSIKIKTSTGIVCEGYVVKGAKLLKPTVRSKVARMPAKRTSWPDKRKGTIGDIRAVAWK